VCEDEDVELFVDVVERIVRPLPIVDPAVSAVIFLRYRFTEAVVQVLEKLSERAKVNLRFVFDLFIFSRFGFGISKNKTKRKT
jgi:hypothetical protein